ncbi:helix-turn-helix domain-containing protein [Virgibacillus sp. W0181]|uniref:helix-turn-helix domain-containing protein n=1 Tax=Virgibacillus sp. W0181 TaxID=3391581 RepID=UPI003F47379F
MTVQHKAYKFRIHPNKVQKQFFEQSFGCSRFVFNRFLGEIKSLTSLKSLNVNLFKNELKHLKCEFEWLKDVDSISLQASIENLNDAMVRFFKNFICQYKLDKSDSFTYLDNVSNGV